MSRTRTARTASAIALLTVLLAACGSSGTGQTGTDTGQATTPTSSVSISEPTAETDVDVAVAGGDPMDDLCALVPADAAATAVAEPVDGGTSKRSVAFDNASCRYRATGSDASLTIWYYPELTTEEWEETLEETGMAEQQPVDGIGDAAYLRPDGSGGKETKLAVLAGGQVVWVILASPADPTARADAAEAIARIVLDAIG